MIQIDGPKRQVYIKLTEEYLTTILRNARGQVVYKHDTGEVSYVHIAVASMGF